MTLLIVLLLLLAAAAGVLGAVLKFTVIVVLSLVLSVVLLSWIGIWYAKRRMRRFRRDVEIRLDQAHRRRAAYDVRNAGNEPRLGGSP